MVHLCREKYRLELKWDRIEYPSEGVAVLIGARFEGPVLRTAQKINSPDFIDLDLTPQHLTVLGSYYIVRLNWDGVEYVDKIVKLSGARLTNDFLKIIHKLEDKDHIVINTEKHEEKTHAYHLVYESTVVREDKEPYKYRK